MGRTVAIGIQDFGKMIEQNYFYVDKTLFLKEWWENGDDVTLITRPRRFGKTLMMSTVEHFFSISYAEEGELFDGLDIWKDEACRELQGSYPVISLSFARVKEQNYEDTRAKICEVIRNLYIQHFFLRDSTVLQDADRDYFDRILAEKISNSDITSSLYQLSNFLYRYYGKKVIILLDEYDTPMQEAYVNGYWEELVGFTRSFFNSTFKTNPYLERGLMTGITRVSKESIFSDLNNLKVVTTTSDEYAASFGFTEKEVFASLEEFGLGSEKEDVKAWYDGFIFGNQKDIYNPWSIINFLDTGKYDIYWANSSSNALAGKLIRQGEGELKEQFGCLLHGENIEKQIDEQIVYNQLDEDEDAVWSLLAASGYLKILAVEDYRKIPSGRRRNYTLAITNQEVHRMFEDMVHGWFASRKSDYNAFLKALLQDDVKAMNVYMNKVALNIFSSFDTGNHPSGAEPERFYHGFVLGLMVDLQDRYVITSNRESGFGRYDVMLEPRNPEQYDAVILEFKVQDSDEEETLKDTVQAALLQIKEKQYETMLINRGIPKEKIRSYGFAFCGKTVLIG